MKTHIAIPSFVAMLFMCLLSTSLFAAEPVSKSRLGGVAIGGHDAALYHELDQDPQHPAVEGAKRYTVIYKGASWHFASEESSQLFAANPEKYAPAYNGFCANALSLGKGLVRTDGTHWEILDDKLYLFYAGAGRDRWLDGQWEDYKTDADAEWARLSQ